MRVLKLAVISFVVFFIVMLCFSLLVPSHIRLSKAINIHAGGDSIFSIIKDTARWQQWHPGFQNLGVGATLSRNNLSLKEVSISDTLVVMELQQGAKRPVTNSWALHQYAAADSVTLQWYMDFKLKWYPWQKFSSLFYEGTYGKMMEKGLNNIKTQTESNMK
jgi:hypothetical protein